MVARLATATVIDNVNWSGGGFFLYTVMWNVVNSIGFIRTILCFLYEAFLYLFMDYAIIGSLCLCSLQLCLLIQVSRIVRDHIHCGGSRLKHEE